MCLVRVAIPSGILVKKLKCLEFLHPVYHSKPVQETRTFDFGLKIEKSESDSK